jgi:hypothetical protein
VQFAPRQLAGFKRVTVPAHGSTNVTIDVNQRSMSYWSQSAQNWVALSSLPMYVGDADWIAGQYGQAGPVGDPANDPGLLPVPVTGAAAPTTTASLSPGPVNGWYSNPTLTLTASEPGGTIASTNYTITPPGGSPGPVQTYTAPVVLHLTPSGSYTITYWSTDTLGDVEAHNTLVFNNDAIAPTTTITVSPTPVNCSATPASGSTCEVNATSASFTLSATDDPGGSGVASTWYTVDGGPTTAYAGAVTVSGGGGHNITYWSVDVAGNVEATKTLTISLNATATTPVTGTVPSTLELSVGSTQPNLGMFTAGVAATYTASLAATATSTASAATLQAADTCTPTTPAPAGCSPGHLLNTTASGGPYALAQGLQVDATSTNAAASGGGVFMNLASVNPATVLTYNAPVTNDAVTIGFKQVVGANDPLRTGTYTKTITFTLSTSTP